jgi:hypothetical protein
LISTQKFNPAAEIFDPMSDRWGEEEISRVSYFCRDALILVFIS